jgi:hypothetical protein
MSCEQTKKTTLDREFLNRDERWNTAILTATKRHTICNTPGMRKICRLKTLDRYGAGCRVCQVLFYLRLSEWPVQHHKDKAGHKNSKKKNRAHQQPISYRVPPRRQFEPVLVECMVFEHRSLLTGTNSHNAQHWPTPFVSRSAFRKGKSARLVWRTNRPLDTSPVSLTSSGDTVQNGSSPDFQ